MYISLYTVCTVHHSVNKLPQCSNSPYILLPTYISYWNFILGKFAPQCLCSTLVIIIAHLYRLTQNPFVRKQSHIFHIVILIAYIHVFELNYNITRVQVLNCWPQTLKKRAPCVTRSRLCLFWGVSNSLVLYHYATWPFPVH